MKNLGYGAEDIMRVLQRVYDETEENRDRALKLYDHMEAAMLGNKGDLVVLSQMADHYLEQATRQSEMLVKLVAVQQKLNQFGANPEKGLMTDVNTLLEVLDKNSITPFSLAKKKKQKSEEPEKIIKQKPQDGDVELEADL